MHSRRGRRRRHPENYLKTVEKARRAVLPLSAKVLAVGMTDTQVLNLPSCGPPARIARSREMGAWREEWTYPARSSGNDERVLYFENGRLVKKLMCRCPIRLRRRRRSNRFIVRRANARIERETTRIQGVHIAEGVQMIKTRRARTATIPTSEIGDQLARAEHLLKASNRTVRREGQQPVVPGRRTAQCRIVDAA